jgi:hypothetical protein
MWTTKRIHIELKEEEEEEEEEEEFREREEALKKREEELRVWEQELETERSLALLSITLSSRPPSCNEGFYVMLSCISFRDYVVVL